MSKKKNNVSNAELEKFRRDFNKENKLSPAPSNKNFKNEIKELADQNITNENNKASNTKYSATEYQINLPKGATDILLNKEKLIEIDNLYLLHHKYSLQFKNEKNYEFEKPVSFIKAVKLPTLSEIKDPVADKKLPRPRPCHADEKATSQFNLTERTKILANTLSVEKKPICFEFNLLDKLAIGIGEESPYDDLLLMTLHPLYGLPYLPATAIKGMLLSYYEQTDEIKEKKRDELFGNKKGASQLIFFDTFPEKSDFKIEFDVFTPHYKGYYGGKGKAEPTDDQDPVVITFPVVKKATFNVYIACRDEDLWNEKLRDDLYNGLEQAFQLYGIGAKTALGYGLSE